MKKAFKAVLNFISWIMYWHVTNSERYTYMHSVSSYEIAKIHAEARGDGKAFTYKRYVSATPCGFAGSSTMMRYYMCDGSIPPTRQFLTFKEFMEMRKGGAK